MTVRRLPRRQLRREPASEPRARAPAVELTTRMTRDELNAAARAAGVESPETLPSKDAVVAAIRKAGRA